MITAVANYWTTLSTRFGTGWNRFWFKPQDAVVLCAMRIVTGTAAFAWLLSLSPQLTDWFGPQGWLPIETVKNIYTYGAVDVPWYVKSPLNLVQTQASLWTFHMGSLVILFLFTLGWKTRLTNLLSLVVMLAYVHRAPLIFGQFETVLVMICTYLCLGPSGIYLSLDGKRGNSATQEALEACAASWSANVSVRLIQVHLSAIYILMGLSKLGGETWWAGDAIWWLTAQQQSPLVYLEFLRENPLLLNAWTHADVWLDLLFGLLIWIPLARPLLMGLVTLKWLVLSLVSGLLGFCLFMIAANLVFVTPSLLRNWLNRRRQAQEIPAERLHAVSQA